MEFEDDADGTGEVHLRVVMEPLLKTKLLGDYRSSKQINMKRVIGYIAR